MPPLALRIFAVLCLAATYWMFALLSWFLFRRGWWTWLPAGLSLLAAGSTIYALVAPGALPHLGSSVSSMLLALFVCVLLFLLHPRSVSTPGDELAKR